MNALWLAVAFLVLEGIVLLGVGLIHALSGGWLGAAIPACLGALSLGAAWALARRRSGASA